MKKMRNGKRGFTLLEIVIVVAIIVILSTGAFLGIAATVNKASDMQQQLTVNNGENFEAYARNQVESYGKNMVYWDPIPNYTPENQAKKMKEQMMAEGWTDGEITFEYQTDGWHIIAEWDPTLEEHRGFQTPEDYKLWKSNYDNYLKLGYTIAEIEAGCKNGSTEIKPVWNPGAHNDMTEEAYLKQQQGGNGGSTPTPVPEGGNTPTPVPEGGDSPTPVPTKAIQQGDVPDTSSGRPSGNTTVTSNVGQNATGSNIKPKDTWNNGKNSNGNLTFPKNVQSVVVYIPDGAKVTTNTAQSTDLGNGYYRWTFQWSNQYSSQVYYSYEGNTSMSDSGFYVVEYTES